MNAPKGVHLKALAGNVKVASNMDVILQSAAGLVSPLRAAPHCPEVQLSFLLLERTDPFMLLHLDSSHTQPHYLNTHINILMPFGLQHPRFLDLLLAVFTHDG